MEVEQKMNMSLDDLIKSDSAPARAKSTKTPRKKLAGKAKVIIARSLGKGAQNGGAVKQQARQVGRQALGVQRKSLKPSAPTKRTVVTVVNGAAKRKVAAPRTRNVAVTIRNAQATRQVQQRSLQARLGKPVRAAGLAHQGARQAGPPAYGFGPKNLLPRGDYAGAGRAASAGPLAPTTLRRQPQRGTVGAAGSSDFGVSRRMLGESLAQGRRVAPQRRSTQFVDYDQTSTGLRMDYGR